jgi:hypothetical protein
MGYPFFSYDANRSSAWKGVASLPSAAPDFADNPAVIWVDFLMAAESRHQRFRLLR